MLNSVLLLAKTESTTRQSMICPNYKASMVYGQRFYTC